jgi:Fic family protein
MIDSLYKEWLTLQPLKEELQRRMDQQFMFDFNYNSNHLEGNTLTYGQTKLLLLFGDTIGNASIQDYEEMKAHNVGVELMKMTALDKERTLSETFIRELNKTILVRDFWKTSKGGDFRYQIKVGVYKTRPNSVITPSGELFNYASPEETPALMSDLVKWYNEEEQKGILLPFELASLFHYRYIRIHPFEDGNGRIARLLVNYILLRHNYPMIVVRTDDRNNYLKILHQCDLLTGKIPTDGAYATFEQTKPLIDYITKILEVKLKAVLQLIKGEIKELVETKDDILTGGQLGGQKRWSEVLHLIMENPFISRKEIAEKMRINPSAVQKHIQKLKSEGYIKRVGGDRGGYWKITN